MYISRNYNSVGIAQHLPTVIIWTFDPLKSGILIIYVKK